MKCLDCKEEFDKPTGSKAEYCPTCRKRRSKPLMFKTEAHVAYRAMRELKARYREVEQCL